MLYSALVPEILPDVLGCPDITIERAVRDAAIEFCDSTLCYTVDQDPEPVTAGMDTIDLEIPSGTRLVQVLRAQMGPRPLTRIPRSDLFETYKNWKTDTGHPVSITFESETSVRLVPISDKAYTDSISIRFAVTPTRASTSIPDTIGERYFKELTYGAKYLLMVMPGQTWTNPNLGGMYRAMFERGIREAMLTVSQDQIAGSRQVRFRRVV